jgi:hypothetical protein
VKNVPGRKTDVRDCQWLQYLHSVGLLRASFRPDQAICALRSIYRYRQNLLTESGQHIQHMHGALDRHALRMAASTLHHDKSYLGDKYRRLRAKLGAPKAITAMAHRLPRIIWHLLTHRVPFDMSIFEAQEKAYQTRRFKSLYSAARHLGFQLVPLAA